MWELVRGGGFLVTIRGYFATSRRIMWDYGQLCPAEPVLFTVGELQFCVVCEGDAWRHLAQTMQSLEKLTEPQNVDFY